MPVCSGDGVHSVGVRGFSPPPRPYATINDRHLRSHGKIGDCEQSMRLKENRHVNKHTKTLLHSGLKLFSLLTSFRPLIGSERDEDFSLGSSRNV